MSLAARSRSFRFISILSVGVVLACASVDYTPPAVAEPPPLEIEIEAPFAEVWSRLEAYLDARASELDIKRMERDLGQVEIKFGPIPPGTYADCGQVTRRSPDYSGAFTDFLAEYANGQLQGDVIVRARRGQEALTPVTISVRYVLTASTDDQDYSMLFNSTTPATLRVGRSCRSNYVLETNVIRALRGL
ncbi:MAG: hypothetical protein ACYSXF_07560 [Planctomycetota bacterium]|jgi:hypothetical protein